MKAGQHLPIHWSFWESKGRFWEHIICMCFKFPVFIHIGTVQEQENSSLFCRDGWKMTEKWIYYQMHFRRCVNGDGGIRNKKFQVLGSEHMVRQKRNHDQGRETEEQPGWKSEALPTINCEWGSVRSPFRAAASVFLITWFWERAELKITCCVLFRYLGNGTVGLKSEKRKQSTQIFILLIHELRDEMCTHTFVSLG